LAGGSGDLVDFLPLGIRYFRREFRELPLDYIRNDF
jgi:hypothetical protein